MEDSCNELDHIAVGGGFTVIHFFEPDLHIPQPVSPIIIPLINRAGAIPNFFHIMCRNSS
jgi:hypothetical protein